MKTRYAPFLQAALLLLAGCTHEAPDSGGPHAGKPTEQGQSMQRMMATVAVVRAFGQGSATQTEAVQAAGELADWSAKMGALFPPEEASRYVDFTPDMARKAPQSMQSTSDQLLGVVRTGDRAATVAQLALVEKNGCGACHQKPY